jgi:microcystin-dependent protein
MRSILTSVVAVVILGGLTPQTAQAQSPEAQCLVGEIIFWAGSFAPVGFLPADGSTVDRFAFPQLFAVLGFRYGGNFESRFNVPDLRGRTPLGAGQAAGMLNRPLGTAGGSETVTLQVSHLPPHTHQAIASGGVATSTDPHGNVWAAQSRTPVFAPPTNPALMSPAAITNTGGDQPHENMSPFLTLTPLICARGLTPQPR